MVEVIRAFSTQHDLSGPGVVAVSGGADSVALLRGLLTAGHRELTLAHFNHRLRGSDSDADENFTLDLAGKLELPVRSARADVAAEAVGENLEAAARRLRYDWLTAVANEVGARWLATGHTADDQAETVLHRIIRGTGIQGLRGIAPERVLENGIRLVRPLLTATRADVLAYLAELNQAYREDASNRDPRFTRNRIRHELIPLLRTFNPAVVEILGRLAVQADEAHRYIAGEAIRLLTAATRPLAGSTYVFDTATLTAAPDFLVREAFRTTWTALGWPMDAMTAEHWDRLVAITRSEVSSADFPGGVHVRRAGRVVQLQRRG